MLSQCQIIQVISSFFNAQLGQMKPKSDRAVVAGEVCKMHNLTGDLGRCALVLHPKSRELLIKAKVRSLCGTGLVQVYLTLDSYDLNEGETTKTSCS